MGGYLTLYFDDKVGFDPEQYTVDVEFSQTDLASAYLAGNASTYNTVKISDSRNPLAAERQKNPNIRDFVANSTNLPLCHLHEKGRGYVKFYLEPFMLRSFGTYIIDRMKSGEVNWVVESWYVGQAINPNTAYYIHGRIPTQRETPTILNTYIQTFIRLRMGKYIPNHIHVSTITTPIKSSLLTPARRRR